MSLFWENAEKLLDAAQAAAKLGCATDSMTVVIGPEGSIHLLAQNDSPLERLREERGARMVYRVAHIGGRVAVEGTTGASTCRLVADRPPNPMHQLLRDNPRYLL